MHYGLVNYIANDTSAKRDLLIYTQDNENDTKSIETIFRAYLVQKFEDKNSNLPILQSAEPSYVTPEDTPEERAAKVKFILLKELGIIDFLISQNYSNSTIGKILLPIAQIKESYTKNILTADFMKPDTTNSKSAYKDKNIVKALRDFEKMQIDLDQLKYLPEIKKDSPHLFE